MLDDQRDFTCLKKGRACNLPDFLLLCKASLCSWYLLNINKQTVQLYDYSLVYLHMPNSYELIFVDKNNELIHQEGERFYQKITLKLFLKELHL